MITTDSLNYKYESVPESEKDQVDVIVEERPNGCIVHVKGQEDKFYHSPAQAKQDAGYKGRRFYYKKFTG